MIEIPLTQGKVALVDDEDGGTVSPHRWYAKREGRVWYAYRNVPSITTKSGYTTLAMHRYLTDYRMVDHKNGNGLDNRRSNLRPADRKRNGANRGPNTAYLLKGVIVAPNGKFRARITVDGHQKHLGVFHSYQEAAEAYDAAALLYFGEFARINSGDVI